MTKRSQRLVKALLLAIPFTLVVATGVLQIVMKVAEVNAGGFWAVLPALHGPLGMLTAVLALAHFRSMWSRVSPQKQRQPVGSPAQV
jgi:hypothetical protein